MLGGAVKCGYCLGVFSSAGPSSEYLHNTTTCAAKTLPYLHDRISELEAALRDIRAYVRDPDGLSVFSLIEKRVNAALGEARRAKGNVEVM